MLSKSPGLPPAPRSTVTCTALKLVDAPKWSEVSGDGKKAEKREEKVKVLDKEWPVEEYVLDC